MTDDQALDYARVVAASASRRDSAEAPAQFTREWLIDELERAGRTLQSLPARGTRPAEYGSAWPDVVHAAEASYGWTTERARPPVPSAQDIKRMDIVFGWVALIPERQRVMRRIVMMRSLVDPVTDRHLWSWRKIGTALGTAKTNAQYQHNRAIDILMRNVPDC